MKRWVIFLLGFLVVGLFLVTRTNEGSITIEPGDGISVIAGRLSDADIIRTPLVFKAAYFLYGDGKPVFPGFVKVADDCSLSCLVRVVLESEHHVQRVTLLEGQDLRDLAKILERKKLGNVSELYALAGEPAVSGTTRKDYSAEFSFLKNVPAGISYEGYLFPDTYEIVDMMSTDDIIRTFLKNFDRRVTKEMRVKAEQQKRSLHEVVTLASILEKEVRSREDRELVADLLLRRLEMGMGLQVDASVNYATAKENLFTSAADRASNSLWNTYKHRGLPPGPISNPSLDAIEAALNPKANDYLFYLTGSDGRTHFARSFEEHVANKRFLK